MSRQPAWPFIAGTFAGLVAGAVGGWAMVGRRRSLDARLVRALSRDREAPPLVVVPGLLGSPPIRPDGSTAWLHLRNALGHLTRFEYDAKNRLAAVEQATAARTEYSYDPNGKLIEILDAEGRRWPRTYDALGKGTLAERLAFLEADGVEKFSASWHALLAGVEAKASALG